MKVRFFDPGKGYLKIKPEIDSEIQRVLSVGKLVLQEDGEIFEKKLAEYVGTEYAVALNSGTDALELSLRALRIGEGDEVVTVSNTFKATITAIRKVGAKPVLVDINEDYLMDMNRLGNVINPKTKAIIPVHLSGDMVDIEGYEVPIIEDAAQALGAEHYGVKAGAWGLIGCFSFYPAKILGAYGDAGAITTSNKRIADWVRNYRNHCKDTPGEDGTNSRLDNIQAAILNVKFRHLADNLARRKEIAEIYDMGLDGVGDITTPSKRLGRVYQDYIIRTEKRTELLFSLKEQGIETMIPPQLPHLELKMPYKLPVSEEYNEQFLRLPCNENLELKEAEYVVEKIKTFYAGV